MNAWKAIALALACCTAPWIANAGGCTIAVIADLKVTLEDSSPLVRGKIDGADVSLIADSGAFYSTLSEGTVAQFKLPTEYGNPYMLTVGIGGTEAIMLTKVKVFSLAGQFLKNVTFTISDNEMGAGVAGLLGQNVLGLADADYDLAHGSIRLVRPSGCGDRPFVVWDKNRAFSIIPLQAQDGPFKQVGAEAFVNGKRIKIVFDTGASTSILSLDAARRAGVDPSAAGVVPGGLQRGIGRRMIQSWIAPIASFKIGDEEVHNTRLRIAQMSLPDTDMLLGADFFLSHRVFVSNSQRRIYFTYNGGPVFNLTAAPLADAARERPLASTPAMASDPAEPADAEGFSRRGSAFAGRREFAPAIADLTRATTLAPAEARYFTQRAAIYLENGEPVLAMADLDHALKLKPDDTQARVSRAELRVSRRENAGASADLAEADRLLPKEADVRLTLAGVYDAADEGPAAIAQYSLWIKAHPDDNRLAQALNGRCWVRGLWSIDSDKAVADCDGALRRDRKVAAYYDSRGLAHLRRGENDLAISDYEAALALRPNVAWSLFGRGIARLRKGQKAEGQADIQAATAQDPGLPAFAKAHGLDH